MDIQYRKKDDLLTVYFNGELDEYSASKTRSILDQVISENLNSSQVVFDLSGISFMDSTGVGLLIGRYKKLRQYNIPSFLSGANVATEKVIELAGLYSIMPKY